MSKQDKNDKLIVMTTEKIRCWAKKHMDRQMVDDFVQECAIRWFEGRSCTTPFEWMLADYLRKEGHDNRKGGQPLDVLKNAVYGYQFGNLRSPYAEERKHSDKVNKLINSLPQLKRICVILRFSWGLTQREIAHCFGVDEARISQIFAELKGKYGGKNSK